MHCSAPHLLQLAANLTGLLGIPAREAKFIRSLFDLHEFYWGRESVSRARGALEKVRVIARIP